MRIGLLILILLFSAFKVSGGLKVGDPAPGFSLADDEGVIHTAAQYRGKTIVLYFYPKDDTPGCTKEACSLRDGYADLMERGVVVLGVSYDNAASHRKFKEKHKFPFDLLSDSDKSVAKAYGADGLLFSKRITFVIGPDGKIAHVIDKVEPSNHARQILDLLDQTP
ncbi:peroxiredoxin [bacterium]|nr:peroxiredoxin [candidate division CSSED10-310 bacterium]